MYGGGHLLKRAFKWARNNPDAIGRGINTLSKFIPRKYQGIGNAIRKTATLAQSMAPKNSYIGRLASSTLKSNDQPVSTPRAVTYESTPMMSSEVHPPKGYKRYL